MGTTTPAIPRVVESGGEPTIDGGGGGEEGPRGGGGGGGDHGGGGGGGGDGEEEEFGPILKYEDVARETEARGAKLPADMLEAAKSTGLRELILQRYLDLQVLSPFQMSEWISTCRFHAVSSSRISSLHLCFYYQTKVAGTCG